MAAVKKLLKLTKIGFVVSAVLLLIMLPSLGIAEGGDTLNEDFDHIYSLLKKKLNDSAQQELIKLQEQDSSLQQRAEFLLSTGLLAYNRRDDKTAKSDLLSSWLLAKEKGKDSIEERAKFNLARVYFRQNDLDSAGLLLDDIISKSDSSYGAIQGTSFYYKGRIAEEKKDFVSASTHYKRALESGINASFRSEIYRSLGIVYRKMGVYPEAVEMYSKAAEILLEKNDLHGLAKVQNSMGILASSFNRYLEAENYFKKAIRHDSLQIQGKKISHHLYNNLGLTQIYLEKYSEAKNMLSKALSISERKNDTRQVLRATGNLARAYKGLEEFDKADEYYRKSIEMKMENDNTPSLSTDFLGLADNFSRQNVFDSADYYFKKAKESLSTESIRYHIDYYQLLSQHHKAQGDWQEAYAALDSSEHYARKQREELNKKSLTQISFALKAKEEEMRNQLLTDSIVAARKKAKIALAAKERLLERNMLLIFALIGLFVFSILLAIKQRQLKRIGAQQAKLNDKLNSTLEENNNLMNVVVHDLKMPFNRIRGLIDIIEDNGAVSSTHSKTISYVRQAVAQGFQLINDLNLAGEIQSSYHLEMMQLNLKKELDRSLERFEHDIRKKEIEVTLNAEDAWIETNPEGLGRILDNLLSNAIKFSPKNGLVSIRLKEQKDRLHLSISDGGKGFKESDKSKLYKKFSRLSTRPTDGENSTGLGLFIVKELCEQLRIGLELESEEGNGATFTLTFDKI